MGAAGSKTQGTPSKGTPTRTPLLTPTPSKAPLNGIDAIKMKLNIDLKPGMMRPGGPRPPRPVRTSPLKVEDVIEAFQRPIITGKKTKRRPKTTLEFMPVNRIASSEERHVDREYEEPVPKAKQHVSDDEDVSETRAGSAQAAVEAVLKVAIDQVMIGVVTKDGDEDAMGVGKYVAQDAAEAVVREVTGQLMTGVAMKDVDQYAVEVVREVIGQLTTSVTKAGDDGATGVVMKDVDQGKTIDTTNADEATTMDAIQAEDADEDAFADPEVEIVATTGMNQLTQEVVIKEVDDHEMTELFTDDTDVNATTIALSVINRMINEVSCIA